MAPGNFIGFVHLAVVLSILNHLVGFARVEKPKHACRQDNQQTDEKHKSASNERKRLVALSRMVR